jgi:glycine/D-amino acid oxidase-like deaminating enzyme
MRVCVVGAGLAGSLLTWRLVQATTWPIDLVCGHRCHADATAASGGAVRAYEVDPEQRWLATASLMELLGSRVLREWSGYRSTGSLYLLPSAAGVAAGVADIEALLPGSATVAAEADLADLGAAGLPEGAVAVRERQAGHVSPGGLRDAVLGDPATARQASMVPGRLTGVWAEPDGGGITCEVDGRRQTYDLVVLATGAWTPELLRANNLPADGYRTKWIQYCLYPAGAWRPPQFVDELTGVYGRPTDDGGLLLGVPTDRWEADPDRPPSFAELPDRAAALATSRFPQLRPGPAGDPVVAADCYTRQPGLALRPARPDDHRLFTFTGGGGGSVKTALAASQRAAVQLAL